MSRMLAYVSCAAEAAIAGFRLGSAIGLLAPRFAVPGQPRAAGGFAGWIEIIELSAAGGGPGALP